MWGVLFACVLWAGAAWAVERTVQGIWLEIGEIAHPAVTLSGLRLRFAAGGVAQVHIDRLRAGGRELRAIDLRCERAVLDSAGFECRGGRVEVDARRLPLAFAINVDFGRGDARVVTNVGQGRVIAELDGTGDVRLTAEHVPLEAMLALAGPWMGAEAYRLAELEPAAQLDGRATWDATNGRARIEATLSEGRFASSDGLLAGEALGLELALDAREQAGGWRWSATASWRTGAAYVHPLYVEAGPTLEAEGFVRDGLLRVERADAHVEGIRHVRASADVEFPTMTLRQLDFVLDGADLSALGPRWLAPLLFPAQIERVAFAGELYAAAQWRDGALVTGRARLADASFGLAAAGGGEGLALGPIAGDMSWSRTRAMPLHLKVAGGRWEKLVLGGFVLDGALSAHGLRLERTSIPLLDGAVVIEGLALERAAGHWSGRAGVVIEPVSMPALTNALGLPAMSGVLSASLPGVRITPGEVALEGALVVSVFDGYLQATGLRLLEPFGVASHLTGDIEARHLDLAQLTETFSFGSISGFIDADVRGLELARWRPVAFDARIASSPGDYRRRISQRAVENISALGGSGAIAALQRSLLGLFETFGYRELGLSCVLHGGVCEMAGIEEGARADGGFPIVRGGGVPALDVIGYNRRVDWNELVDRLQRVIAENVSPELH